MNSIKGYLLLPIIRITTICMYVRTDRQSQSSVPWPILTYFNRFSFLIYSQFRVEIDCFIVQQCIVCRLNVCNYYCIKFKLETCIIPLAPCRCILKLMPSLLHHTFPALRLTFINDHTPHFLSSHNW